MSEEISYTAKVKNELKKHITKDSKNINVNTVEARDYLRKAFVEIGEINNPNKETNLEFNCKTAKDANKIIKYLSLFGIESKLYIDKYYKVYIKNQSYVILLLAELGLKKLSKEYDEIKSQKSITCYINRKTNFEAANIKRSVLASVNQLDDIKRLLKKRKLSMLDKNLQEVIIFRKKYQEDNLTELAQRIGITKSCLTHRLNKIKEMSYQK